jgi:hypothetical protein
MTAIKWTIPKITDIMNIQNIVHNTDNINILTQLREYEQ